MFSADDEVPHDNSRLMDISLAAIQAARQVTLVDISARIKSGPRYPDMWPGEHHKLLAGLMIVLKPTLVLEIGTSTGLSALTMKAFLEPGAKLMTFDIHPWNHLADTCLHEDDFADGRLTQHVADLSKRWNVDLFERQIQQSEFIFIDAAKDRTCEQTLLDLFRTIAFERPPIILLDDTQLWNMLHVWRRIDASKLDLTSFGHWSGTGIVEWRWPLAMSQVNT
jgi:predicted O-methyltransferase YrrM